jgi:hypothetical protein
VIQSQLKRLAFQESKKASDGIQAAIKREEGVMDGIIALRKKNHQDARASAERERKKNDARFVRRIDQLIRYIL